MEKKSALLGIMLMNSSVWSTIVPLVESRGTDSTDSAPGSIGRGDSTPRIPKSAVKVQVSTDRGLCARSSGCSARRTAGSFDVPEIYDDFFWGIWLSATRKVIGRHHGT